MIGVKLCISYTAHLLLIMNANYVNSACHVLIAKILLKSTGHTVGESSTVPHDSCFFAIRAASSSFSHVNRMALVWTDTKFEILADGSRENKKRLPVLLASPATLLVCRY